MDTEANFVNQLSVESSATFTSTHHFTNQLTAEDNLAATQRLLELAAVLSEAVPSIAPALQAAVAPVVKQLDIMARAGVKDVDTEPTIAVLRITPQETEQINRGVHTIADDYRKMLLAHYTETLRQDRTSFNLASWFIPGLLLFGALLLIFGFIFAWFHNPVVAFPTLIGGGIAEAIGIIRSFKKEISDRLTASTKDLLILTQYHTAREHIDAISDPKERDKALQDLIKEIQEFNRRLS